MNHPEIIRLVISYTFLGVIVFTAIITCLSIVGIVKIENTNQQKKLFNVLIIELVVGAVGLFFDFASLNTKTVIQAIKDSTVENTIIPVIKNIQKNQSIPEKVDNDYKASLDTSNYSFSLITG